MWGRCGRWKMRARVFAVDDNILAGLASYVLGGYAVLGVVTFFALLFLGFRAKREPAALWILDFLVSHWAAGVVVAIMAWPLVLLLYFLERIGTAKGEDGGEG